MSRADTVIASVGGALILGLLIVAAVIAIRSHEPGRVAVPVSVPDDYVAITIDVASALNRSSAEPNQIGERPFPIPADDVIEGDASLVLDGSTGQWQEGEWVGVRFRGNWPRGSRYPLALDADGLLLRTASLGIGCGETHLSVFVRDAERVGPLTFVLGGPEGGGNNCR